MDYALIGTIARLTNTRPNWDREVTRAVGAARACAIAALIRALGAEVEYADLRGIELSQAQLEDWHSGVVSRCLSAAGIRFSVILFPPGSWALLTVGLPDTPLALPDLDGVTTFRTHELRPGWAPSVPRGQRCSPRPEPLPGRRLPLRNGPVPAPRRYFPSTRISLNEASTKGSHVFARPVFPSLWPPGWNGPPLGSTLGLRTPPTRSRTTHAEVGTGHRARTWNYSLNSHRSIPNPVVLS
jgi:hypothetical protein